MPKADARDYISALKTSEFNLISNDFADEAVGIDQINSQVVFLQGDSTLDLTDASTPSEATIASSGAGSASRGADKVVPIQAYCLVTEAVAADSTAPIVTIQDDSGNSSGLTITLTDGDAVDDIAFAKVSDGDAMTAVDLTSENLEAEVTTAAADAGTAAGECKVIVQALLFK